MPAAIYCQQHHLLLLLLLVVLPTTHAFRLSLATSQSSAAPTPPPPKKLASPSNFILPTRASLQLLFFSLLAPSSSAFAAAAAAAEATPPPPPTQTLDLKTVSKLQDDAFSATNRFQWKDAEKAWTKVLDLDPQNAAAYSNRGNTRTSMGLCKEAIQDFNRAIELASTEPDPNLGRGVAEECLGQYEAALLDYEEANKKNIAMTGREDPVTYNNRANAEAGLGRYEEALRDYRQAAKMQPGYVFPSASAALMLYQLGRDAEAMKQMRLLLVKYDTLVDMKAALAVLYWRDGDFPKAETAYYEVINEDPRYRKLDWVKNIRKWPPRLVADYENFINLKVPSRAAPAAQPVPAAATPTPAQ